ncbi:hypothetical protein EDB84DRAFT_1492397 [Lactarius hengduanensis]|nr:hypothetical protein EDB84DRAFT_1492397 [Lactarius hengduanensis]
MAQLQSISLHFPSAANHVNFPSRSGERITPPALTRLHLLGIGAYSEGFVARIDAPGLRDIEITFFNERIIDAFKLREFIDRIEMQKIYGSVRRNHQVGRTATAVDSGWGLSVDSETSRVLCNYQPSNAGLYYLGCTNSAYGSLSCVMRLCGRP